MKSLLANVVPQSDLYNKKFDMILLGNWDGSSSSMYMYFRAVHRGPKVEEQRPRYLKVLYFTLGILHYNQT